MNAEAKTKIKIGALQRTFFIPIPTLCPGCQHGVVVHAVLDVLEEMGLDGSAIAVSGVGCAAGIQITILDAVMGSHGGAPDTATAIKRLRPENLVFTFQGDGDCVAIGGGALIGALTRGEKFTIIMSNNTNYGTTGGQLAPTTLTGQTTPTCPNGRNPDTEGYPVHTAELVASFKGVSYSARGAVNTPANYRRTRKYIKTAFQKQLDNKGLSFVEVIAACPPNWHMRPVECLDWIEEKVIQEFPLGEFKDVDKAS